MGEQIKGLSLLQKSRFLKFIRINRRNKTAHRGNKYNYCDYIIIAFLKLF